MPSLPKLQKTVSIKEAAEFLEVSSKTLRRWDQQRLLKSFRTSGGHRRYFLEDLERIRSLSSKRRITKWSLASVKPKGEVSILKIAVSKKPLSASDIEQDFATKPSRDKIDFWAQLPSALPQFKATRIKVAKIALLFCLTALGIFLGWQIKEKGSIGVLGQKIASLLPGYGQQQDLLTPETVSPSVLAESTSIDDISFRVSVETTLERDATAEANLEVDGNLSLVGNSITSADDLTITPGGDNVSIVSDLILSDTSTLLVGGGTGTAYNAFRNAADAPEDPAIAADNDLYIGGDLEVDGLANLASLVIGGDTFTDLTGTGLQVSSGSLQTTLGTSIESSEISDDTIKEVDLNASNSPTAGFSLTYNSGTGGFTWTDVSGSTSGWTDDGTVVRLSTATDDVTIGSTSDLAKLGVVGDTSEIQLLVRGNSSQSVNIFEIENSAAANLLTVDNSGNLTLASGADLFIGTIGLNDTGAGPTTSGASLIGTFDEFTNSSSTNVQDVLDDLDAAIGAGGSKWTDSGTTVYLTDTTDELVLGGTSPLSSAKYSIDGDADQIQFIVQGNSTQASNLATFERSDGTDVLSINNFGDVLSGFVQLDGSSTTNGTGSSSKSVVLTDATNFDVGNYIQLTSTSCESGASVCYAKITSKSVNTLSMDHALTWASGSAVVEYHIPEVGGTDLAQTVTNRYGRGYFIAGIVTGSASTTYTDSEIYTAAVTSANSAGFSITTGSTTTSGNSGDITIDVGSAAGTAGTINIGATNASAINIGRAGLTTVIPGDLAVYGTSIGLNSDADSDSVLAQSAAAGQAGADLYWGNDLLCDADLANCGWATSASSPWSVNTTPTPDVVYPTDTTHDVALGGTDSTAPIFFDVSAGSLTFDAPGTGTILDFELATAWTAGTLINANFGGATTQTADITGVSLDFDTNFTGLADADFTGVNVITPDLSISSGATTTTYNTYNNSASGAITTSGTFTGVVNWRGINLTTPNITQVAGSTVSVDGLRIANGTITTGGTQNLLNLVASGVGAGGTLRGLNIGNITGAGGTETAISVGTGWDTAIEVEGGTTTKAALVEIGSDQTSGNILVIGASTAVTLTAGLTGQFIDLATGYTTSNLDLIGLDIDLDAMNDTSGSGGDQYYGVQVSGGTITSSGASTSPEWKGAEVIIPAITNTDSGAGGVTARAYDSDITTFTQTTNELTTINAFDFSAGGSTLTQETLTGTIIVRGVNLALPAITETTGTVTSTGVYITSGTVSATAEAIGINIDDTDITTDLILQNDETVSNDTNGSIVFTGVGQTNNGSITLDLETNAIPTLTSSTDTVIGIDEDLQFIGAQTLSTSTGDLTIDSGSNTIVLAATDTTLTASGLATFTTAATLSMASTTTLNCGNCIDWDDVKDAMTLDTATTIASTVTTTSLDLNASPAGTAASPIGFEITPTWGIDVTDQTLIGLNINANTNSNADSGDILYGLQLAGITGTVGVETAIAVGTGWDSAISTEGGTTGSGLVEIGSDQTSGDIFIIGAPSAVTLSASSGDPLVALSLNLSGNYTTGDDFITGLEILLDSAADTGTDAVMRGIEISGGLFRANSTTADPTWFGVDIDLPTTEVIDAGAQGIFATAVDISTQSLTQSVAETTKYTGFDVSSAGALTQDTAAGTITWRGVNITMPNITQTQGTVTASGLRVVNGTITTAGTQTALDIISQGVGAGNLYGANFGDITAGAGTETAIRIGAAYDNLFEIEGTAGDGFQTFIRATAPSADRIYTLPDTTDGTFCLSSGNCAGGAGGSKWTDDGAITYLTSTTDNLAVGGTDSTSEFFIDIVNGGNVAIKSTGDTENIFDIDANSLTTGSGIDVSSTATAFNGELLVLNKTGTSGSTAFTSDIANITYSQTFDGGVGLNSTGNTLDVSRAITLNNVGNTHTVSGAVVAISDTGTQTQGTLTNTGNVLSLSQNYPAASGALLNLSNSGTGADIAFNTSPTLTIGNTGTLTITDGTNTLLTIADDTAEGDVTVTGDLAVNGATSADITSSNTTASLFDATVTTLNIGAAATAWDIGAATGTGTINNATTAITGILDVNGGDGSDFAGSVTFNDDVTLTLAGTENLDIANTTQGAADLVSIAPTWTADNSADALAITTTYNLSTVAGTQYGLNLTNADNAGNTGVIDALALFSNDQATETLADGVIIRHNAASGTLTDALQIENTTAGGTISNAINILETAGTITTGLNIGSGIGTAISLQNAETIDNTTNGSIVFTGLGQTNNGSITLDLETNTIPTLTSSTDTVIGIDEDLQFIGAQTLSTSTGDLTIDSGSNTVVLAASDTTLTASGLATFTTAATLSMASTTTLNCGNCIDFDDIKDAATLDAATTIASTVAATSLDLNVSPAGTAASPIGFEVTPTWGIDVTDQTLIGFNINPNTNGNTDAGDILYGLQLADITATAGTETAIRIGAAYDNLFEIEGTAGDGFQTFIRVTAPSADRIYTLPNTTDGDFCLSSGNCAGGAGGSKWTDNGAITYFTAYTTDDVAIGDTTSASEFFFDLQSGGGRLLFNPTSTGTKLDFALETEWTGGTLIAADYASATTQTADIVGAQFDFDTNFTGAADFDFTGFNVITPDLTSTGATTTNYYAFRNSSSGALTTSDVSATVVNWYGAEINIPAINTGDAADTVTATGLRITAGTVTNGAGTENSIGINIDDTDIITDLILQNDLSISNDTDSELAIVENTRTLNFDFAEVASRIKLESASELELESTSNTTSAIVLDATIGGIDITASGASAGEDIDLLATGSSINLTSTEGAADGIVLTSTGGGIDLTTTGAAAGEDIDVTSSASLNLTGQEAAIDAVVLQATANNSGVLISAGDGVSTTFIDGNDIELRAEDDVIINFEAGNSRFLVDAQSPDNTTNTGESAGIVHFAIDDAMADTASGLNQGLYLVYRVQDTADVNAMTHTGFAIDFESNEADANDTNYIVSIDNLNTASNAITDAGIFIDNKETTASTLTDAILITSSGVNNGIVDAIDVSNANIQTALRVNANAIEATELDFNVAPTGSTSSITVSTDAVSEDFFLDLTGGTDSSLILRSSGTSTDALQITATAGGIDIAASGATAGEDIDIIATGSSINLTSTEGAADGIVLTSTGGGIDLTTTGAAAGEDIDVTSSASLNLTGQEAAVDAVVISSSADASGVRIRTGDTLPAALANGNDIEFLAEDDFIFNFAAATNLTLDAAATDTTLNTGATAGVTQLIIDNAMADAAGGINQGFYIDYQVTNTADVNAMTQRAVRIDFTNSEDSAGDTTQIVSIVNRDDAANQVTDAALVIDNAETTAATLTNAIEITSSGVNGGVVDAVDASAANIDNALNAGTNFVLFDAVRAFSPSSGQITIEDTSGNDFIYTKTSGASGGLFAIDISTSAPGTCTEGEIYTNDTDGNIYYCEATNTWVDLTQSGGAGPWTDGAGITYLTDTAEDLGIGASATLVAPFSVDVSANTVRIGDGVSDTNDPTLTFYASDATNSGSISFLDADEFNITGAGVNLDSYLDLDSLSATAFTLGDGTSNYITFDGSTDAGDTLFTINSTSSGITSGTGLSVLSDTQDSGTGLLLSVDALTTGTGLLIDNAANTLTTGTLLQVQSTSTAVGTIADGALAYFNWNPGATTTATGDLFRINIGSSGSASNLFNVTDNASSLFRVSEAQIESAVPHAFTAAGDVTIAYDLIFTNQTAAFLKSYGPLTIEAGETFESNNLTLKVYNAGSVIVDGSSSVNTGTGGVLDINVNSITANNVGLNIDYTVNDGTTAANDLFGAQIDLTANDADADVFGLQITSLASTNAAANTFECLLCLTNAENTAGTVLDAIRISSTAATAGSISVGIDFDTTDITDDIELQNGETINNDTDGTVLIEDGGTTTLISASTTAFSINLDDTTSRTERLCHGGGDAGTGVAAVSDCSGTPGDYAEEYGSADPSLEAGDLVAADGIQGAYEIIDGTVQGSKAWVIKSTSTYQPDIIGVVSTQPNDVIGRNFDPSENPKPITLSGRVPVKVSTENGEIKPGDNLTSSSIPGVAMKATERGPIIGRALGNFVSADPNQIGKVITFIDLSWYDPGLALDSTGNLNLVDLEIQQTQDSEFQTLNAGQIVETIGAVAGLVAANVKAGAVEAVSLTTDGLFAFQATVDNLLVTSGLVAPSIKTEIISPITQSNLVVNLENTPSDSSSPTYGKLSVKGEGGQEVVSINAQGDADFRGQVSSESIQAQDATVSGELRAGKIYADEIVTRTGSFADLFANKVSGITREEIEAMLAEAEADQAIMGQASRWEVDTSDGSASLNELTTENLYVTGTAALNSLSVSQSIVLGSDLVLSSTNIDGQGLNTIDSINGPLSIQSSGVQPLYLVAGLVKIDTQGNVQIAGNLDVGGTVESKGLTLIDGNPQEDIYRKLLSLVSSSGEEVGSISATGSAEFKSVKTDKVIVSSEDAVAYVTPGGQYVYETTTNAGRASIPGGFSEVIIKNPNTSSESLIYVTPKGSTENNVLYVKSQEGCEADSTTGQPPLNCEAGFVVGFDRPITNNIEFNWWIVDVAKQASAQ